MPSGRYARILIDSPLPQLDKLFDFKIPDNLELEVGSRVLVNFGRGKQQKAGYAVEIAESIEFEGELQFLASVITNATILKPEIYRLCRSIADRQSVAIADVVRLAIPNRSVAVENRWLEKQWKYSKSSGKNVGTRLHEILSPFVAQGMPTWVNRIVELASNTAKDQKSTIICVPDFRDQNLLVEELSKHFPAEKIVEYSSANKPSKRYSEFLKCLDDDWVVVVGSRSAIYAPVSNLGLIAIWDDGDKSHQEMSSPYIHLREAALIRQQQEGCAIHFLSHSVSTEMFRLRSIGYVESKDAAMEIPAIKTIDSYVRLSGQIWQMIREVVDVGPVLIQVSAKGQSASLFCEDCNRRAECHRCAGPLRSNSANQAQCRWCNSLNINFRCRECDSAKLRSGRPGATRTLSEIGRAFPGLQLIESTYESRIERISSKKAIVVATPGAEPFCPDGFSAVVILDASSMLSRDSLRATEDSIRLWSNAFALGSRNCKRVISGLGIPLSDLLSTWSQFEIAGREFAQRMDLGLPPAVRIASISASAQTLIALSDSLNDETVSVFGPVKVQNSRHEIEDRLVIKFDYGIGLELAKKIRALALKLSSGQTRFSPKSGRAIRPIRIKMDDPEVV